MRMGLLSLGSRLFFIAYFGVKIMTDTTFCDRINSVYPNLRGRC